MSKETRKKRFERVAMSRAEKISDMLRLLGNCSNRVNYDYSDDAVEEMFSQIDSALTEARERFASAGGFSHGAEYRRIFESEFTWIAGFMRNVLRFENRQAVFVPQSGKSITYGELNREVNKLADAFVKDGLKNGGVVMHMLQNCPEFIYTYIATQKLGAVNCPINFRLSPGEIAMMIDDSRPLIFIYDREMESDALKGIEMAKHKPKRVVAVDIFSKFAAAPDGVDLFADYISVCNEQEPVPARPLNMYDETTRIYTSGTTGHPKGVPMTSINEVMSAHDCIMHFPMSPYDKTMNTTPWFHRGGIHSGGPCPTLYVGGTVVIMPKFNAKLTLKYVEDHKLTFLIGVPTVLEGLADEQQKNGYDLSSLLGIVTMGSTFERAACIRYQKILTPNIFNGYGTSESFWNTFLRPSDLPDMAGSAGRSCTDDDVRVVKIFKDRRAEPYELAARDGTEVGEIIIKSPAKSCYRYYNNEESTKEKFYNGYLYTQDLGTWDENSFVSIAGRKDDMIISSGENIYPTLIEEILNGHPKVADSIVTGTPDALRGELVTAYIVPKDKSLTVAELEKYCLENPMMTRYKRPRYYRFISEIPVNATGKKLHCKAKLMAKNDLKNGLLIMP